MNEMIERIRDALCEVPIGTVGGMPVTLLPEVAEKFARVAIGAMREPTEEMVEANDYQCGPRSRGDILGGWQAMIDAALAEDGK